MKTENFTENLKSHLRNLGMTQKSLAEAVGMKPSQISNIIITTTTKLEKNN